jgi:muramidase (phage lysozyme)
MPHRLALLLALLCALTLLGSPALAQNNRVQVAVSAKPSTMSARLRQTEARKLKYAGSHPWVRLVHRTYQYRQCIIDVESRTSGLYHAQSRVSTASGAYQFLDSTWAGVVRKFEKYYRRRVTTAKRAIDAPPRVQDAIAAYAIVAQRGQPWAECRNLPRLAPT